MRDVFTVVGALTLGIMCAALLWATGEVVVHALRSGRRRRHREGKKPERSDWLGV